MPDQGDDPAETGPAPWAAIAGVDLELYATITARLLKGGITERDAVAEVVAAFGVDPARWLTARAGWIDRMGRHPGVRARYGALYAAAATRT